MKKNKTIERLAEKLHKNKIAVFLFRNLYRRIYLKRIQKVRNKYFKSNAKELLHEFNDALASIGCEYWLAFGTLLGAIRENRFISHDLDIDVGVMGLSNRDRIFDALLKRGFKKIRHIVVEDILDAYEETYEYMNVQIDIFYFSTVTPGFVYCYDFVYGKHNKKTNSLCFTPRKITHPFNGLEKYTFLGIVVKIPSNYDEYLKVHYGDDYLIPNPNWDTLSSPVGEILHKKIGIEYKM